MFSGKNDDRNFIVALNKVSPIWRQALIVIFLNLLAVYVDSDFSFDEPLTVMMVIAWGCILFFVPFLDYYYFRAWKRTLEFKDKYSLLINNTQDIQLIDIYKIVVERKSKFLTIFYKKGHKKTHVGFLINKHSVLTVLNEIFEREDTLKTKLFCRDALKLLKNESDYSKVTINEIERM